MNYIEEIEEILSRYGEVVRTKEEKKCWEKLSKNIIGVMIKENFDAGLKAFEQKYVKTERHRTIYEGLPYKTKLNIAYRAMER